MLAVGWSYFFTLDARRLECVIKYLKLFNLELFHWKEILQHLDNDKLVSRITNLRSWNLQILNRSTCSKQSSKCKSKFVKRCDEELIKVDEYPDLFYLNMPDLIVGGRIRII